MVVLYRYSRWNNWNRLIIFMFVSFKGQEYAPPWRKSIPKEYDEQFQIQTIEVSTSFVWFLLYALCKQVNEIFYIIFVS